MTYQGNYRTLVIDDDPAIGEEICEALLLRQIPSVYAQTSDDARDLVSRNDNLRIVVVDYHMPERNGLEMMAFLRDGATHPLAFIMLTGDETQAVAAGAVRAQATDFLRKPLRIPDLLEAISRAAAHLDQLTENESEKRILESEASGLRDRVAAMSDMLRQRERLLEGFFSPAGPALADLQRSHANATVQFLDQVAEMDQMRVGLSRHATIRPGEPSDLQCAPIDLSAIMHRIVPAIRQMTDRKRVQLKTIVSSTLPFLYGDEIRFGRALCDLIVMLVEALSPGDRVALLTVKEDDDLILTIRINSQSLPQELLDLLLCDLPSAIDDLAALAPHHAKLLASRVVIHLHGGQIAVSGGANSEWAIRIFLPLPAEKSARRAATA